MRRWALALLACAAAAAPLAADTVYTRDGKIYKGTVTREGHKITVETEGGKIELRSGQVLHITRGSATPGEPGKTPTTPGAKKPPAGTPSALALGKIGTFPPPVAPRRKIYTREGTGEPEPVAFMLMRNAAVPGGLLLVDTQRQIDQWRSLAHERRRRVLSQWLTPKDFVKKREAYRKLLDEAKEAHRTARKNKQKYSSGSSRYPSAGGARTTPDLLPGAVVSKLQQAASTWGDPTVRAFLNAALQYKTKNYTRAATLFRTCCAEAPRVAAYWQGYGLCLAELRQHKLALASYVEVVRLRPDSRDAVQMLYQGMGALPGGLTSTPVYQEAERLLAEYEPSSYRVKTSGGTSLYRRTVTWLMPGKTWRGATDSLPVPPFDRLAFRQGLGVPVANTTLLVDAECVRDAVEIFVQLAPNLVVPAKVSRTSSYGRRKAAAVPLTPITVQGFSFTPVPLANDAANKATAGQKVVAYALGLYEEMGCGPRPIPGQVKAVSKDGKAETTVRLSAGDVAGPVLTQNGALLGFLAGKTDVKANGGGKDVFIPPSAIEALSKKATRGSRSYGGHSSAKRKAVPIVVPSKVFLVYAIKTELFQ